MAIENKETWGVFKIFERMGLLIALFISWIILISTPLDLLMVYLDPKYFLVLDNSIKGFMIFIDWLNNFFSYWRDLWQWPVIFYSMFFLIGRVIFKDWRKTNLLIWVTFVIAYLDLIFFNTGFDVNNFTFAIAGFTFYPMLILAPANLSIYPEFGALLFIAGYDLLRRSGFDTSLGFILKSREKDSVFDKVIDSNI